MNGRRVLHVAQPVEAGVAVVVRQLVQHQVQRGQEVAVACPATGSLPRWVTEAGGVALPWSARRQPGPTVLGEARALGRLVADWDPDLVHLHSSKAGLVGRLVVRGRRPTVYQPHAWSFLAVEGVVRTLSTLWERAGSRWTDGIASVSRAEQEEGLAHGVEGRWFLCPNGVDLSAFRPADDDDQAAARRELGLPSGPLVVCVGRLSRQKGQDLLLQAWATLSRGPGTSLALVGDGPDEALRAAADGRVLFVGGTSDVRPWYRAASIMVQPSRWEGASLTTREAMAAGLSVVATDVAGVGEVLEPGCGALVPVGDVPALAAALQQRLDDDALRRAEGVCARRAAERSLSIEQTFTAVDAMYEEVLRRPDVRRRRGRGTGA